MKTNIIYSMLLLVAALCSCNSDERFATETSQPDSGVIELTVNAHDFVTDGTPDTRATDNGKETTFEKDDRVGVIILDGSSNIVYNNIPYKYNGSQWVFDSSNGEGKNQCYYDNKAGSLTYIVYYPYSSAADDVKSEADLKTKFAPKTDQQSKEAYRASDLMVWTSLSATPLKTLTAELKHVYASVSFSPKVKYTLGDGNEITYITSRVSDVNLTISDKVCSPYRAEDGSIRCILPVGFSAGDVRYFYTFDGKTYGGTFNIARVVANTRYTSTQQIDAGIYSFDKVQVGDFYCRNSSSGNGYLIPGDAVTLPEDANPVGIVYWVGDPANPTDGDPLLKTKHSDCTHGLVVALQDAGSSYWSSSYEDITNEWLSKQSDNPYIITTLKASDKMQGYANTKALEGYNASDKVNGTSNLKVLPVGIIAEYAKTHPAPTNSSDWYWPSVMELKYMCWGQKNSSGVAGRNMLNTQLGKLGIASLQSDYYWSSTEGDRGYRAWDVYFGNGGVAGDDKYNYSYGVRAVLAF